MAEASADGSASANTDGTGSTGAANTDGAASGSTSTGWRKWFAGKAEKTEPLRCGITAASHETIMDFSKKLINYK